MSNRLYSEAGDSCFLSSSSASRDLIAQSMWYLISLRVPAFFCLPMDSAICMVWFPAIWPHAHPLCIPKYLPAITRPSSPKMYPVLQYYTGHGDFFLLESLFHPIHPIIQQICKSLGHGEEIESGGNWNLSNLHSIFIERTMSDEIQLISP